MSELSCDTPFIGQNGKLTDDLSLYPLDSYLAIHSCFLNFGRKDSCVLCVACAFVACGMRRQMSCWYLLLRGRAL